MMTLEQFLNATSNVPEPVLRPAMVAALSVEPARTPEAYRRFYDRVIYELALDHGQWAVGSRERAGHGQRIEASVTADCPLLTGDSESSDNELGRRCA